MTPHDPWVQDVEQAQDGDVSAFDALVGRFQDAVVGTALATLGNFDDAQDVAQEAFVQAWRDLGNLRDAHRFPAWLLRITQNRCSDLLRRPRHHQIPVEQVGGKLPAPKQTDPADEVGRSEMRERILAAIRDLSLPNRLATTLFYINGYSVDEVAQFLDVPAGTVKRRLHDSRKLLQEGMMDMVRQSLESGKPGPELRREVLSELQTRHDAFDAACVRAQDQDNTEWTRWYHDRRMEGVRSNASQYGVIPDEQMPRMLPQYRQQETFRDDFRDMPRRWGIPEGLTLVGLRELCREIAASPLSVVRWQEQGMPAVRYYPWVLYDRERVRSWLDRSTPEPCQPVDARELRRPLLTLLNALAEGVVEPSEAAEIYDMLESANLYAGKDPQWAQQWEDRRPEELAQNARRYDLSKPADGFFGLPREAVTHVYEIRDLTRRLGVSPIDVIRWTRSGMPCLRYSPTVRWDIRHVSEWLAQNAIMPTRYTARELDHTELVICQAVAGGDATPCEGYEALSGWCGVT